MLDNIDTGKGIASLVKWPTKNTEVYNFRCGTTNAYCEIVEKPTKSLEIKKHNEKTLWARQQVSKTKHSHRNDNLVSKTKHSNGNKE